VSRVKNAEAIPVIHSGNADAVTPPNPPNALPYIYKERPGQKIDDDAANENELHPRKISTLPSILLPQRSVASPRWTLVVGARR
jgi:hypothetical protein